MCAHMQNVSGEQAGVLPTLLRAAARQDAPLALDALRRVDAHGPIRVSHRAGLQPMRNGEGAHAAAKGRQRQPRAALCEVGMGGEGAWYIVAQRSTGCLSLKCGSSR